MYFKIVTIFNFYTNEITHTRVTYVLSFNLFYGIIQTQFFFNSRMKLIDYVLFAYCYETKNHYSKKHIISYLQ